MAKANHRYVSANIRFDLNNEDERRAWDLLRTMNRKEYKSYAKLVAEAIIEHQARRKHMKHDPYLETREKEDAFCDEIREAVRLGMQQGAHDLKAILSQLPSAVASASMPEAASMPPPSDDNLDDALDFIDEL